MRKFSNRYRNYKEDKKLCDEVCLKIIQYVNTPKEQRDCHFFSKLDHEHNIPRSTLGGWANKLKVNPNWRPYTTFQYGLCHRIFTDEEENSLHEYIIENIIKPHHYFSDRNFAYLANSAFMEKYKDIDDDEEIPQFMCSHSFVTDFKARHKLCSRRAHFMKRPEIEDFDLLQFQIKLKKIIKDSDLNKDSVVVNADETSIHIVPKNVQTWAEIGSENIYIHVEDNTKTNFTALLSITSNYEKLPIFLITKSTKKNNEENLQNFDFGDIGPNVSYSQTNAWMNTNLFIQYLIFLRNNIKDKKIFLLIDMSPTHTSQRIIEKANELNIEIIYIPAGCTEILQQLDLRINGILKEIYKRNVLRWISENPQQPIGIQRTIEFLLDTWDEISQFAIMEAWTTYECI